MHSKEFTIPGGCTFERLKQIVKEVTPIGGSFGIHELQIVDQLFSRKPTLSNYVKNKIDYKLKHLKQDWLRHAGEVINQPLLETTHRPTTNISNFYPYSKITKTTKSIRYTDRWKTCKCFKWLKTCHMATNLSNFACVLLF